MRTLTFIVGLLVATGALADTFGTHGGCGFAANDWQYPDTDRWAYFDGTKLEGHEFGCDVAANQCHFEDAQETVELVVTYQGDKVILTSDDYGTWTLERCD